MSLLTVCQGLALNVGVQSPTALTTDREHVEMIRFINEAGEELARRFDWGDLTKTATLTGDGTADEMSLPADFGRMIRRNAVRYGTATVRPLSRPEWNTLTAAEGAPRYFLLENLGIRLWPYLADTDTATVYYQSAEWASSGTALAVATDTSLIDEDLLLKCAIVRWRRQKGMDYGDFEAEYEAALADFAKYDGGHRV